MRIAISDEFDLRDQRVIGGGSVALESAVVTLNSGTVFDLGGGDETPIWDLVRHRSGLATTTVDLRISAGVFEASNVGWLAHPELIGEIALPGSFYSRLWGGE